MEKESKKKREGEREREDRCNAIDTSHCTLGIAQGASYSSI